MKPVYLQTLSNKLAFLIVIVFVLQNITATVAVGNETDRVALLAIKSQLVDSPNRVLSSWNDSIHHCAWEGITCGRKHKRVTEIDLESRGLAGTISPFIGNLSFLNIIKLDNNSLYGEIPNQLSQLFRLQVLWLDNNTLVGEIPSNISRCANLRVLSLGFNKLQGKLPTGLGALLELEDLSIHSNHLTGPLFGIIQNLTSLRTISVAYNSFTGTISDNIGSMRNLRFLGAVENGLFGTLPTSLFNLSFLEEIQIADNQLQGELPLHMGFTNPRLKILSLAGNNFTGSIPITIRNLTSLEKISLQDNGFTGTVPEDFSHFPNLTHLQLGKNNLVSDINFISTLVNCSKLNILSLGMNNYSGTLPKSVANLSTTVTTFTMTSSLITGTFPQGITNLINLEYLVIQNSKLTASLPHDLGKLFKLQDLILSSNRLTGKIPNSIGNLTRVSILYLDDNILEGSLTGNIGNCKNLLYLKLQKNRFSGNIPNELFAGSAKFIQISLSDNYLEGSLPFAISKQINLIDLELSNNKLSGVISDGLSDCYVLQYLKMDENSFHGHIPPSLASLTSLVAIDASRNHLSGQIPAFLSKCPLTYLNLAYNDFEGMVPTTGVFLNASRVFLVDNNRLCGGIQALGLPKCVEKESLKGKKRGLSYTLKKVVISTVCAVAGMLAVSLGLYLICRRKKMRRLRSNLTAGKRFTKVSYNMLLKATSGFSTENLLGTGSFGSVFKGILDGNTIAVKVLYLENHGASKSFVAECKALRNVRHRNLVGIITACSSIDFQRNDFRALVYEFMPNGSLDRWLLGDVRKLSLSQRVGIAIDVAHALNYLHNDCETPIVHCDLGIQIRVARLVFGVLLAMLLQVYVIDVPVS